MEYLKSLNNKDPSIGNDSSIKEIYSCGHNTPSSVTSNAIGSIVILVILFFMVYRFIQSPDTINISNVLTFSKDQEVLKMLVGLLLLTNIKTLSNSLIANIILPIIKPILPILSCNLKIKIGLFDIKVGEFVSDVMVFGLNLYLIYFVFVVASSY